MKIKFPVLVVASLFLTLGCSSISSTELISSLNTTVLSEGFGTAINDDSFVWNYDGYNLLLDEATTLAINYYPADATDFWVSPLNDSSIQKIVALVSEEIKKNLDFDQKNTINDTKYDLFRYGFSNNSTVCILNVSGGSMHVDENGRSYVEISVSCGDKKQIKSILKKVKYLYDSPTLGLNDPTGFIVVDKELDGYYHLGLGSLYGGGAEMIVAEHDGELVNVYAGNSGDIPCVDMEKYDVPKEIYGDCYYGEPSY